MKRAETIKRSVGTYIQYYWNIAAVGNIATVGTVLTCAVPP